MTTKLSSRNRDSMGDKAKNVYSLVLYRKRLLTSGLKRLVLLGPRLDKVVCPEAWRHDERTWVIRIKIKCSGDSK